MECQICCNLYNEHEFTPRNLDCGHTYCEKCLNNM